MSLLKYSKWIAVAVMVSVLSAFLWWEWHTIGRIGVPLDDSWIHFQFARRIASGQWFTYNLSQQTAGSTAPLWALFLAPFALLNLSLLIPSIILSVAGFAVTVGIVYHWVSAEWDTTIALFATLGTILVGRLIWAALSGMEVTTFTALMLLTLYLYHRKGLNHLTTLCIGIAAQLRPEAHLLFAVLLADSLIRGRSKQIWQSIILYGLIALPYALVSLTTTGKPFANTFYAKADVTDGFHARSLYETIQLHSADNWFILPFLIIGIPVWWKKERILVCWFFGMLTAVSFLLPLIWHHGRYTMPLIPIQMMLAAGGVAWCLQKFGRFLPHLSTIILLGWLVGGGVQLPFWATMLSNNVREIEEIDVAIADWLQKNTPSNAVIAVDDIGAIAYLSERKLFDLGGLISPEMWPAYKDSNQTLATVRLLAEANVDYLAIFPDWHPLLATESRLLTPIKTFTTTTHTIIGSPLATIYKTTWPLQDAHPVTDFSADFGELIELKGYEQRVDNDKIILTLFWHALAKPTTDYKLFVHIKDSNGTIIAQTDVLAGQPLFPTSRWEENDNIRQTETLPYIENTTLWIGLYTELAGRLPTLHPDSADSSLKLLSPISP